MNDWQKNPAENAVRYFEINGAYPSPFHIRSPPALTYQPKGLLKFFLTCEQFAL